MIAVYVLILFVLVFLTNATMPLNGKTGLKLGPLWGPSLYLLCGTAAILAFILLTDPKSLSGFSAYPWYGYVSAVGNIVIVGLMMLLVSRVGVGILFACITLGRFVMALVADHFDIAGAGAIPITLWRIVAVVAVVAGSFVFTFSNDLGSGKFKNTTIALMKQKRFLFYVALCITIGAIQVIMESINSVAGSIIGTAPTVFIYLSLGASVAIVVSFIKDPKGIRKFLHLSPIHCIPGIANVIIASIPIVMIPVLGVGLYIGLQFISTAISSMIMDHFGWFDMPKVPIRCGRIIGTVVMTLGVLVLS